MRRLGALGLRGRIVGALVLTAAVTLTVAAFALLGPLERRLQNAELAALVGEARAREIRTGVGALTPRQLAINSNALQQIGLALVNSSGANEVYVLDAAHALRMRTTDAWTAAADPFDDAHEALPRD